MKKTTLLFILFLTGLMACSTPEDKPKKQNNAAPAFQLFPTTNMWTFIKLDTRNGRMWTFITTSPIFACFGGPNGSHTERQSPCQRRRGRERPVHSLFHKKHVHIHSPRPTRWQNVASTMGYRCQPTACYSYKSDSKFY